MGMVGETRAAAMIVDDHPGYRAGLNAVLAHDLRIASVQEAGSVSAALGLAQTRSFDLVIVDVVLPETGGLDLVRTLPAIQPTARILVLSMIDEPIRVAEMLRAGATGYAFKSQPVADILEAVYGVLDGHRYLPPQLAANSFIAGAPLLLERLTARERTVFDLLVRGLRNQKVAEQLMVSRRTIDAHRRHIMQKLGARSIVDLIRIAAQHGAGR
jgi:two-component system, NarL family, response regulator FusR